MFRLKRSNFVSGEGLLESRLFDESTFYKAFAKDLNQATSAAIIESPYLTERRAIQFSRLFKRLHDKKGIKIRVNTRNPKHHDKLLEIQAWKAIKVLRDNGVKVCTYNDMRHRKIAIIDNQVLWEGSLNILSQAHSKEIMRRTISKDLCRQMLSFTKVSSKHW